MSGNTFGTLFAVTNFGESHGPAIGCVIDGCPPGMDLSEADIQGDLDRRRPRTPTNAARTTATSWRPSARATPTTVTSRNTASATHAAVAALAPA